MGVDADAALDQAADARPLVTMQIGAATGRKCDAVTAQQQLALRQRVEHGGQQQARRDAASGRRAIPRARSDEFEAPAGRAVLARRKCDGPLAMPGFAVAERIRPPRRRTHAPQRSCAASRRAARHRRRWRGCLRTAAEWQTCYCFGMPAFSITAAHFVMSPFRRAISSSGELALASTPRSRYRDFTSGMTRISCIALFKVLMMSGGVPMRREDAVPRGHLVARHPRLRDGRHIGHIAQPLYPGRGERPDFLFNQHAFHRSVEVDHELHVVAQERDQDFRRAAIGNDLEVQAGRRLEQLGAEILCAADIDGADVELAGLRACRLDEIVQRFKFRLRSCWRR